MTDETSEAITAFKNYADKVCSIGYNPTDDVAIIEKALNRAAECEKEKQEAIECAKLWMAKHEGERIQSNSYKEALRLVNKQADDMEERAQGLLKALEWYAGRLTFYHGDETVAQEAIAEFNADKPDSPKSPSA